MDDQNVHKLLQSILENEEMQDATVVIKNANVEIADGLISEILRVTISKADKNKFLHLIIKVAPTDPEYRKIVELLFHCEIFFYDDVLPHFNQLEMKYTGNPLGYIPKFYKAVKEDSEEFIILEDLSAKGYAMLDRRFVFNDDCMKKVMHAFGEFHALSFALQKENPAVWETLENGVDQNEVFTGEVIGWFCNALRKANELFKTTNTPISEKLMFLINNFASEIRRLMKPSLKYPSVMVHMDPWCNNCLFKMTSEGTVEDFVLIDFQQATKGSPVLDIACLLYMNASADCIKNWKEIVRVYHDSLIAHGKTLSCDIEAMYSWEMFLDDWHDYSRYGLLKSFMGISLNTQKPDDVRLKTAERIKGLIVHADAENFL